MCAAVLAWAQENAGEAFRHGVELHRAGDIEGAIREYRASLALDPRNAQALSNLGAAYAAVGRYEEAIGEYRKALEIQPGLDGVRLNLGLAYYKSARYAEAEKELLAVHGAQPQDLRTALLAADCELRQGEAAQAANLIEPYAAEHADDRALDYLLGMALIRAGRADQGQAWVDRILRDGDSAEAHYLAGVSLLGKGQYPQAVAELGQAVKGNAELPSLESYYGQALLATGDADGAEAAFRKALALDGNDFDANMQLAAILAERGRTEEALPLVRRAAEARPASPEAHLALANLLAATWEAADARREREHLAATWPEFWRTRNDAAAQVNARHLQGTAAPGFQLAELGTGRVVRLGAFRGAKPVVLAFGSYTCPQFRHGAGPLNTLYAKYGGRAAFLMVYIREAHGAGGGEWQSTQNEREGIDLAEPKTARERAANASLCARRLHIAYPVLTDGLDGRVEGLYAAWPSRVYVIGTDGVVSYESGLDEQSFRPVELSAAIERALGASAGR